MVGSKGKKLEYLRALVISFLIICFVGCITLFTGCEKAFNIVLDLLVFCGIFAFTRNKIVKWLFILPLTLILLQVVSVSTTGAYIIPLTILNLNEYSSVGGTTIAKGLGLFLFLFILGIAIWKNFTQFLHYKTKIVLYTLCLINWFFFYSLSPCVCLGNSLYEVYKQLTFGIDAVAKYKVQQKHFKNHIYVPENIDSKTQKLLEAYDFTNKNVIVFFIEGFNYNNLSYINKFSKLTPNIDTLLPKSLSFVNYFNHTAATFRGLRGQLTSSYQYLGGYYPEQNGIGQISELEIKKKYNNTVYSLPEILKPYGYKSYFINPHSDQSNISIMLKTMHFDKVYGCEYSKECNTKLPIEARAITDKQLFSNIQQIISQLSKTDNKEHHFFVGIYNLGTHLGMDSPDEKYHVSNEILNSVYNFDYQFGKFYTWFKQSALYDNTIIILTADHCAFPSEDRAKLMGEKSIYPGIFLNTIPFIVSFKDITPAVIDVAGKNSIDFAPTLLHLLRINEGKNYFLGCSLFEKCNKKFEYYEAIGNEFYSTEFNTLKNVEKEQKYPQLITDFYNLSDASLSQ